MHYYRFNIKDWTRDTAHLTVEEEGVYRRLLDLYYESESPIPVETQPVIRRLRLAGHEQAVGIILGEFFTLEEGVYRHRRCDDEIAKYHAKAEANRANGGKGGRPKKPTENPVGSEMEPTNNLNHKPPTTNQEPIKSSCVQQADHAETFERFWRLYPKKSGRKPALASWLKLKPGENLLGVIMTALAQQSASHDWTKNNGQFVPNASTWLNQSRWEDEVRDGRQEYRAGAAAPSLVDQIRELNRIEEQRQDLFAQRGELASLHAIDGQFVVVDD